MRIIARGTRVDFGHQHPETQSSLMHWYALTRSARWRSMDDVRRAAPKAKILNGERARFEIAGGNYRLVVAFDFRRQVAYVKFIGTHAEYDRVDALTASRF